MMEIRYMTSEEVLRLIPPSLEYANEISAFRQEFIEHGGYMDGSLSLRYMEDVRVWLDQVETFSSAETCPKACSPVTQYLYVREHDRKVIGAINIKLSMTDDIALFGHIGYSVCPSERRKGYATSMLRDVLPMCRMQGFGEIIVSCFLTNIASRKVILRNGVEYESSVIIPGSGNELERYKITLGA